MMFAAAVGHRSGRATPSLRGAPQRQSMEIVRRETIYRNRNAVQTNPATSVVRADSAAVDVQLVAPGFLGTQPALPFNTGEAGIADTVIGQIGQLKGTAGVDEPTDAVGRNFLSGGWRVGCGVNDGEGAPRQGFRCRRESRGRG